MTYSDTPGWKFVVEEVSMGVYQVKGSDGFGRTVERTGTDPDVLLQQCKVDAMKIIQKTQTEENP